MDNTGEYSFHLPADIPIALIPSEFQIVYTIEDDDIANPEADSTTLTISFVNDNLNEGAEEPASTGDLIELSYSGKVNEINPSNANSSIKYDLNELFSEESDKSLDDYLSTNQLIENDESDLSLDNTQYANVEQITEVIITNSFLKEGATLSSDASPENVPQQIELDSNDQI
jgi:hypothetical protein